MYQRIYNLLNNITGWRSCSGMPRGCVYKIRLWPLRRDDHSGVLIGACGTQRSDRPASVTKARESIDSTRAKSDRLHAYRDKWQIAATSSSSVKPLFGTNKP